MSFYWSISQLSTPDAQVTDRPKQMNPPDEPIASTTIGPDGGTLSTDDFILDVPAGGGVPGTRVDAP